MQNRRDFIRMGGAGLSASLRMSRSGLSGTVTAEELKVRVVDATVEFFPRKLIKPLQLSSGLIEEVTEARTRVTASTPRTQATGIGSVYLSDLWAWPDVGYSHVERDQVLRELCVHYSTDLGDMCGNEPAHPLELGLRLHESVERRQALPPRLARLMCASPFDAALHDAAGRAFGLSAFDFYDSPSSIPSADKYFREGAVKAISRMLREPKRKFPAWWIIGANDCLDKAVKPAVQARGYFSFKLKLLGKNTEGDVKRTVEVFRALKEMGLASPRITGDTNEANPNADSVREYLLQLKSDDAEAFAALEYLEQPTNRDIIQYAYDWKKVSRIKPVMLDEGLTDFTRFDAAVEQGWSGFALKTCRGHSFALTAAAWAHENKLAISLQDLTNPGYAAIHAALFAAHVPTINGVELNSPQYTPSANEKWLPRLSGLFEPKSGFHHLDFPIPPGLGSSL